MPNKELILQAKEIICKIIYITIATSDKNGNPWNSPVYSAFDDEYNFYRVSRKENQHSKNIKDNNKVFTVIYDSTVPEGTGVGVYMRGKARQLNKNSIGDIIKGLGLLYLRKKKTPKDALLFLGLLPRRVYKFIPEQIWINTGSMIGNHYIDSKIDITNEFLKGK